MRPCLLLFGDSITERAVQIETLGWQLHLQLMFNRRMDILNRGYSGYNTRYGVIVAAKLIVELKMKVPILVIIAFGANDAASGFQNVPLNEYGENLSKMVELFRSIGSKVILVTPPGVLDSMRDQRSNAEARLYADRCKEIGSKLQVSVVDMWQATQVALPSDISVLDDGLHLGIKGNRLWYEELVKVLEKDFPNIFNIEMELPRYDVLKTKDYGKMLG